MTLFCDWWLCRESVVEACSAALQIDSSDTRALYRRYSSALPVRVCADSSSCTSSVLLLIGARLAWRRGLAHNRLKKFDRAKSDLKRACVPLHLPSNLCRWCRNTR